LGMLLLAGCVITGCGSGDGQEVHRYDDDGYLGMTNTNPGLPNQPSFRTYSNDQKLAEDAVKDLTDIEHMRLLFDGGILRVTLDLADGLSSVQAEALEAEVRERLRYMLPRYDVKVTS